MSRTHHHRPYRIRTADPATPGRYAFHGCGPKYPCDLSDVPRPPRWHWVRDARQLGEAGCEWMLPYGYSHTPPRDYRRAVHFGPQRAAIRAWSRDVMHSYNSDEDDFPEPPDGRARNSAKWMWD